MAAAQLVSYHREYRICGYSQSNPQETLAWFSLQLRLHGNLFSITVSESRFRNSPNRVLEFQGYLAYLASDEDAFESDDSECIRVPESDDVHRQEDMTMDDCFAWAVQPFIDSFKILAPKPLPASRIQQYFNSKSYECQLGASDDRLEPGPIELLDMNDSFVPGGCGIHCSHEHSTGASALFPAFLPSQIDVLGDDPCRIFDDEPRLVRVQGEAYFFKSFEEAGEDLARKEIRKYEEIAKANFGPEVRTSRLFGIVQDDQNRVMDAVDLTMDEITRMRWKEQIKQTLEALHKAGIIWGDAKADNVIVDKRGDAWIIDFGGGYTEGWIDKCNAGTITGDDEGLQKIMELLSTGGDD